MKKKLTWASGLQTVHQQEGENSLNIYCFIFLCSGLFKSHTIFLCSGIMFQSVTGWRSVKLHKAVIVLMCASCPMARARCVMDHCVGNVGDASNLILIRFFRFPPAKTWSLASINIQFLFQTVRMTCVAAGGCHSHHHPQHHSHHHHHHAHVSVTPAGLCSGRTDKCVWTVFMVTWRLRSSW